VQKYYVRGKPAKAGYPRHVTIYAKCSCREATCNINNLAAIMGVKKLWLGISKKRNYG
jgi:hypothetical protein